MARNNMTFTASMRLRTAEFKKGVQDIRRSITELKNTFLTLSAALGAGLGLTKLVSNLKDTAVQLSIAKNTLDNVSRSTKEYTDSMGKAIIVTNEYGKNMAYIRGLAKEYGQDLIALTTNFAQFHAACENTNLGLDDQKFIFEQLTRAAAYYHMSADRTKDMMNAVTQMMSKGKVAAEELRRQLGNALPGAFNIMAASLGLSTQQLDDMMRKGQILAAEALPKFAQALKEITEGANFDSLQMSLNRLRNSWYDFVERSGAEGAFDSLVKGATRALDAIALDIDKIKAAAKGLVAAILSYNIFGFLTKRSNEYVATQQANYAKLTALHNKYVKDIESRMYTNGKQTIGFDTTKGTRLGPGMAMAVNNAVLSDADVRAIVDYNKNLIRVAELKRKITGIRMISVEDELAIKRYNKELLKTQGMAKTLGGTLKSGMMKIGTMAVGLVRTIGAAIASIGIMALVSAIIGGITTLIEKEKERKKYAEETANIYSNYLKDVETLDSNSNEEIIRLNAQKKIIQDNEKGTKEWAGAVAEINKTLGLQEGEMFTIESKTEDIVGAVDKWIERLKTISKINKQIANQNTAEEQVADLRSQIEARAQQYYRKTGYSLGGFIDLESGKWNQEQLNKGNIKDKGWIERNVKPLIDRLVEQKRVIDSADAEINRLMKDMYASAPDTNNNHNSGGTESDISKIRKNYEKELEKLNNLLKEHAITQEEYNDKLNELYIKFWQQAAATGKLSIDALIEKADKGKTLKAIEKWYVDLANNAQTAAGEVAAKLVQTALEESADKAIKEAQKVIDEEFDKWLDKMIRAQEAEGELRVGKMPSLGKRDNTFDYQKTPADVLSENYDLASEYVESLRKFIAKYKEFVGESEIIAKAVATAEAELSRMNGELPDLERAMKIAKVKEDIQEIKDEMNKLAYSSLKDMANSMDRVVKAVKNIKETFEDDDASPWEQFMAVFNGIVQMADTIYGMYETLQQFSKMSSTMESAELTLINLENKALQQQIQLRERLNEVKQQGIIKTAEQAAADYAETAAENAKTSAEAKGSIAGATNSGAGMPFPYNLLAIAAGVAAVIAALASMDKFAEGGIVGGHSFTGDKQLARVNSGEMILNGRQQKNLLDMANGKGGVGSGKVEFKIRGTDLIGVMNNEMSKRRG